MHPVLKRIAINGVLAAGVLAVFGFVLAHLAGMWAATAAGRIQPEGAGQPLPESLVPRVPVMMAVWGFLFVAVGELVRSRLRRGELATPPVPPQPDDTEKLLNELLAQAESRMALEQGTGDRGQETEKKQEQGVPAAS